MSDKTFDEIYGELLNLENVGSFLGTRDDEDEELFMTSKEEVKAKRRAEEVFGIKPASGTVDIEESIHFKSYAVQHEHKYTETELARMHDENMDTIVHDYGDNDIFHMSDEDRAKNDMLAELSIKLGGLKRTYRRVDQYIEAMRTVVQAWKLLEKQGNYIHDPDEFFTMVGNEQIISSRIVMPKLKRMDDFNIDQLIMYISNPDLDPEDLMDKSGTKGTYDPDEDFIEDRPEYQEYYREYMDNLTEEEKEDIDEYDLRMRAHKYAMDKIEEEDAMRLLSAEEAQYLVDNIDNPPDVKVDFIKRKFIKGYDQRISMRKHRAKKLNKSDRVIQRDVHDMLINLQNNPVNRDIEEYNRSYLITHGMFDTEKAPKDFWDDLRFDGSWANDSQVYLYDLVTREEFLKLRPPKERYQTYGDMELNQFFSISERNGVNVTELRRLMELSGDRGSVTKREVKELTKQSKKMEARIVDRLSKLNDDPKFKKLVAKSEKSLNKYYEKTM